MSEANGHHEKKRLENPPSTVKFKIQRREKEGAASHWDTFEIPYRRNLNVISALMEIRKNPVTVEGKTTTPPVWDMSCLEQVCGICTMVIDGRVRFEIDLSRARRSGLKMDSQLLRLASKVYGGAQ